MNSPRFDIEAWARARFEVHNEGGGRGFDRGIRIISCPFHHDETRSAWVNVSKGGWLACFNPSCEAHGGMNVVEAERRLAGLRMWTQALVALRREFPGTGFVALPIPPPPAYEDWCIPPPGLCWITRASTRAGTGAEVARFLQQQWGLSPEDGLRWDLRYCVSGRHAWRVIIPIVMGGKLVAFQSRTFRNGEPKYRTSQYGKEEEKGTECGRPAEAILFNYDAIQEGSDVVLVEGAGDVMRWECVREGLADESLRVSAVAGGVPKGTTAAAVGLLGTALTDEKAALLAARKPQRVIVALDVGAERESLIVAMQLEAWGLGAEVGQWVGAKDAGAGARLVLRARQPGLVGVVLLGRMGR